MAQLGARLGRSFGPPPRYVVRKTKQEVIELITAWAALEGMAARLITLKAADQDISKLRKMFTTFENGQLHAKLDEYSQVNIEFHQSIIRMSENRVLIDLAENLFAHMHDPPQDHRQMIAPRARSGSADIEALEGAMPSGRASDHALGLAEHVARHADYLD
jgi:DNA-binding GntR family transcriptional regulator